MHGILHNGSKALIWPKYDCSIAFLNPRELSHLAEIGISFTPPRGWTFEYSEQKMHRILARFDHWTFMTTINAQKAIINRTYDMPAYQRLPLVDIQFDDERIETCLTRIPHAVKVGDNKIILEDSLEWVMEGKREVVLKLLQSRRIPLERVHFLSGLKCRPGDIHFDTFEAQTIVDFLKSGNNKEDYDSPHRDPTKKFICLNRRTAWHRNMVYKEFLKREWLEESHFSFSADPGHGNDKRLPSLPARPLPGDTYDPIGDEPRNGFTPAAQLAFNDSSYYLVTETIYTREDEAWLFITEKTYRAFLYQIPFILVGNPGALRHLQSLGYEVDFDGIGMEYNDTTLPIPELLNRFQDLPIGNTSREQCRHNYELYWKRAFPHCWDRILGLLDL